MKKYKFISRPTSAVGFKDASTEELRVLVAIMESNSGIEEADIISLADVTVSRAKSALAFWEAEGVVIGFEDGGITEEFSERLHQGELFEEDSVEVAQSIRNENLAGLFEECAKMIEKPVLTTTEIKCIAALVTQYGLSEDYILELAAALKGHGKLTVNKIRDRALSLVAKGIDNTESLGVYLRENEGRASSEMEFRKLLGIYDRKLSEAESRVFAKWADEFGYSTVIVGEAYNLSVMNTGKLSIPYMDKVLTSWYVAGCKTVEECLAVNAQKSADEKTKTAGERQKPKTEAPKPRYGDFDINDAFAKALERSNSKYQK